MLNFVYPKLIDHVIFEHEIFHKDFIACYVAFNILYVYNISCKKSVYLFASGNIMRPLHVKLMLCRVGKLKLVYVNDTTTCLVGKLLATNRTYLYSSQQCANMLSCCSHTPI